MLADIHARTHTAARERAHSSPAEETRGRGFSRRAALSARSIGAVVLDGSVGRRFSLSMGDPHVL